MADLSRRLVLGGGAGLAVAPAAANAATPRNETLAALSAELEPLAAGLARDPHGMLAAVRGRLKAAAEAGGFEAWRGLPTAETHKTTVLAGGERGRSWKVQLFFVPEGRSHPPHCHENLASCLLVVDGRLRLREYERLRDRESEEAAVLRKVFDGALAAGEGMVTAEDYRNAHWFGAVGGPVLAVNFKASGHFRRELLRLRNRRYLDASAGGEGPFAAPFISRAEAKARFATRPV